MQTLQQIHCFFLGGGRRVLQLYYYFFFECTVENKHEREVKTPGEVIKEEWRA